MRRMVPTHVGGWLARNRSVITMRVVSWLPIWPSALLFWVLLAARPDPVGALSDAWERKGGGAIGRYHGGGEHFTKRWCCVVVRSKDPSLATARTDDGWVTEDQKDD